jgi:hypothetical protein
MSHQNENRKSKDRDDSPSSENGRGRESSGTSASGNRGGKVTSHERAAFHHETAAHHHTQAAKHSQTGNDARADLHADAARGHGRRASEHGDEATRAGGSGGPDRDREVNRHSLSQVEGRGSSSEDGDVGGYEDEAGRGRRAGSSTQRSNSDERDQPRGSGLLAGADEGDDSEQVEAGEDRQQPANGQRRTGGRNQDANRRHV